MNRGREREGQVLPFARIAYPCREPRNQEPRQAGQGRIVVLSGQAWQKAYAAIFTGWIWL